MDLEHVTIAGSHDEIKMMKKAIEKLPGNFVETQDKYLEICAEQTKDGINLAFKGHAKINYPINTSSLMGDNQIRSIKFKYDNTEYIITTKP